MVLPLHATLLLSLALLLICTSPLGSVSLLVNAAAQGPRLVILPAQDIIRRPVKKSIVLTCKGDGDNPSLFSDLIWFGPNGDQVDRNYPNRNIGVQQDQERLLLVFNEPSINDGGAYTCRAKFQNTEALNAQVVVSFYQDITFDDCPSSQALVKGTSSGVIRCGVSASPPPIVTWKKNGEVLTQASHSAGQQHRYIIENNGIRVRDEVTEDDAGRYDVAARVEETGEVLYQFISVAVHVTPRIEEIKQERDATDGEETTMVCRASGVPPPVITWFDPQKRNLSTVGGYYVDRDHGLLTISKVRRYEDHGKFVCLAENAAGHVEHELNVEVLTRPSVTSFENVTFTRNQDAVLECRATGLPLPKLSIRRDGDDRPLFQGLPRVTIDERVIGEESVLKLTITHTERTDDGLYYCAAENKGGRSDRVGHLTVEFPPDLSSTNTLVKTWESNPINLTCLADAIPNATIYWWFRGQKLFDYGVNSLGYRLFEAPGVSNLLVHPLGSPGAGGGDIYGSYRCEATNVHGRSEVNIKLEQATTPYPPGPITIEKETPTTLLFRIGAPSNNGGLPVRKYHISYREETQALDATQVLTWPATDGPYKIEHLIPRRSYWIKFAAESDVGVGQWTQEHRYVMPYESVPEMVRFNVVDQPDNLETGTITASSSNEYYLRWTEPPSNGRYIEEYKIKYYRVERSETGWMRKSLEREVNIRERQKFYEHNIRGLDANAFYRVELRARNAIGESSPSFLVFRTPPGSHGAASRFMNAASSWALILGLTIAALFVLAILLDIYCYVKHRNGLLYYFRRTLCGRREDGVVKEKPAANGDNKATDSNSKERSQEATAFL